MVESFIKKIEELYHGYCRNLYLYDKEDHTQLEEKQVKHLYTPFEKKKFFVVKNSEGIAIITTTQSSSVSLSFNDYRQYLSNQEGLQHTSYTIPVFNEILEKSGYEFDTSGYWVIPSNPENFDILECEIGEEVEWGRKQKNMKIGDNIFVYISGLGNGYIGCHGVITELNESEGSWKFRISRFLDKSLVTLDSLRKCSIRHQFLQDIRNFSNKKALNFVISTMKEKGHQIQKNQAKEQSQMKNAQEKEKLKQQPLNQILYGPPGTGKTYNTINKALEIILQEDQTLEETKKNKIENILKGLEENPSDKEIRKEAKKLFNDFIQKGQIAFVTFHQSYGYEEFVEGIKPVMQSNQGGKIEYEIKNGIFKKIALQAKQNTKKFLEETQNSLKNKSKFEEINENKTLWRLYTLPGGEESEDYFLDCIEKEYIWASRDWGMEKLKSEVKEGDYVVIPSATAGKRSKSIRAFGIIGTTDKDSEKSNEGRSYRKVQWYWHTNDSRNELYFDDINFAQHTLQRVLKGKESIFEEFNSLFSSKTEEKPHILIIDEINRGNISKIFGELITLIEEDKRIGNSEELTVTLPYSQEEFGVPRNLYIIGTMNTADRSITSLDTALRRRFEFIEMMPNPNVLPQNREGIDLQKMLKVINERIAYLCDREKTIGHAFFAETQTIQDLKKVFQTKIIPLLQEYFYDNYALIQAVLNDNGMIEEASQQGKEITACKGFQKLENLDLEDKVVYCIAPDPNPNLNEENIWNNAQTYIDIYDEKQKRQ